MRVLFEKLQSDVYWDKNSSLHTQMAIVAQEVTKGKISESITFVHVMKN